MAESISAATVIRLIIAMLPTLLIVSAECAMSGQFLSFMQVAIELVAEGAA